MIFVTIGSAEPFDRLLDAVAALPAGEEVVAQCGASTVRPGNAGCVDFLSCDDFLESVARARVVVTHAGVGTVMAVLAAGKRPVVVPRLARFGEAVDDHQLAFARRLDEIGAVALVEDLAALPSAVAEALAPPPVRLGRSPLAGELREYVQAQLTRERTAVRRT
jgi:UDP-N-acetylglucosamine transferase subunit ALG13